MRPTLAALALAWSAQASAGALIVVQEAPLAGFQYHAARAVWPQLRVGDRLDLVREPDNPHDARAIRVDWQGQPLGYVPRRENAGAARLLDQGNTLHARIVRLVEARDPWLRVRFEIVMPLSVENPP